jgi:uncharacterized protein YodC (DUF2158 family)
MEFMMLAFTKRGSIALAAALGITLGMSLSIPAFADAAPPATQSGSAAALHSGDLVRVRSGGPLMTVTAVEGDKVNCTWTDWDGRLQSENFPIDVLSVPVTAPPLDPNLEKDEQATDRYYKTHCPSGSVSVEGVFTCAY